MRILVLLIFFIFSFASSVFAAVSVSISNVPGSVNQDQEFTVDVTVGCASCGASYLRGVFFYPEDSITYLGFTQNNTGDWISTSSDKTLYFKTEEGSWSGQVKFKFDSEKDPGSYFFKVGRYTSAGDKSAEYSSSVAISVDVPATPTETSTPTPTAASTSTPTSTPTPTATPTPSVANPPLAETVKKTVTQSATSEESLRATVRGVASTTIQSEKTFTASVPSEILGASVSATSEVAEIVTPVVAAFTVEKDSRQVDSKAALAVGAITLGALGLIFFRLRKILIKNSKM